MKAQKAFFAVEVTLKNGTKTLRPYKNDSYVGAIHTAGNRADVLSTGKAHKITEEQFNQILSRMPENKRDTSKRTTKPNQ